jgi:hypothetical protein
MFANTTFNDTPLGLVNIPNAGQIAPTPPMPIPVEVTPTATGNNTVLKGGIIGNINRYDADDDSEFDPWEWNEENVFDESAFLGINFKKIGKALGNAGHFVLHGLGSAGRSYVQHLTPFGFAFNHGGGGDDGDYTGGTPDVSNYFGIEVNNLHPSYGEILRKAAEADVLYIPTRILTNRLYHNHLVDEDSSYTGDTYSDFTGLSMADIDKHQAFFNGLSDEEQEIYSDFLGINFKKIGKAIGGAFKAVGKAGKFLGKTIGKVGAFAGKTIAKGAVGIGKGALALGKLGVKVLASQAGLGGGGDTVTDQSNGTFTPTNWASNEGGGGGYNPAYDPEFVDPGEYDNETGDQNSYENQRADLVADDLRRQQAAAAVAEALEPEQSKTNIWLWVALAAFLGIGFYLIKSHKLKI